MFIENKFHFSELIKYLPSHPNDSIVVYSDPPFYQSDFPMLEFNTSDMPRMQQWYLKVHPYFSS
jgi:hypothetical protein